MEIRSIKRLTLCDYIVEEIKNMIINGTLKPGDKLPTERELAEKLGVGRSSVREAVKALHSMGLVARTKDGIFIDIKSSAFFTDPRLLSKEVSAAELFEARKVIEVETAGMAAERASAEELKTLEDILNGSDGEPIPPEKFVIYDMSFHLSIAKASHNRVLLQILGSIKDLLWEAQSEVAKVPGVMEKAKIQHRQVFEAIREGNPEAAKAKMFAHLDEVQGILNGIRVSLFK
ncbi:MAG TPA: FadR family transcriptional regulator [Firmicutes bacterium]|nr:FadR family transcriptional regulator [Bacillota bacterium]